jgi:hypothetical protein
MPNKQIFFDPQRKRWKRLLLILNVTAVTSTLVLAIFIFNVLRFQQLPELLLPTPKHNYKALHDQQPLLRGAKDQRPARRKTSRKPSDIPFNTGEGLRAAYYVPEDPASYSSLKEHVRQIDLLFPEWLHVDAPQGILLGTNSESHREYAIIDSVAVRDPDEMNKVKRVIQASKEDVEIFPHLNNFNPNTQKSPAYWQTKTRAPRCASRSSASLLRFRPIAVYRWTSKTCPTAPARLMSALFTISMPTCTRAISASMSTLRSRPPMKI